MIAKALLVLAFLAAAGAAAAQGFDAAPTPLGPSDGVVLCKTCSPPTGATKEYVAPLSEVAAFVLAQMPGGNPVQVAMVPGNNTGTYPVSGITAANKLLLGVAVQDMLSTSSFNYSPSPFALVGSGINPIGWQTGAGVITDPAAVNWTGFSVIWLYQ